MKDSKKSAAPAPASAPSATSAGAVPLAEAASSDKAAPEASSAASLDVEVMIKIFEEITSSMKVVMVRLAQVERRYASR